MDDSFSEMMMPDFFTELLLFSSDATTSDNSTISPTTSPSSASTTSQASPALVLPPTTDHTPAASIPQKDVNFQVAVDHPSAKVVVSHQGAVDTPLAVVITAGSSSETTSSIVIQGKRKRTLNSKLDAPEGNEGTTKKQPRKRCRYEGLSEEEAEIKRLNENKKEQERQKKISENYEELIREMPTYNKKGDSKAQTLKNATNYLRSLKQNQRTIMGILQNLIFIINLLIQYIIQDSRHRNKSPEDIIISKSPYITVGSIRKMLSPITEFCKVSQNESRHLKPLCNNVSNLSNKPISGSHLQISGPSSCTHLQMLLPDSGTQLQIPVPASGSNIQMAVPDSGSNLQMSVPVSWSHLQIPIPKIDTNLQIHVPDSCSHIQEHLPDSGSNLHMSVPTSGSYINYSIDANTSVTKTIAPVSYPSVGIIQKEQTMIESSAPVDKTMLRSLFTYLNKQPTDACNQMNDYKKARHVNIMDKPTRKILPKPNPQILIPPLSPEGVYNDLTTHNDVLQNISPVQQFPISSKWFQNSYNNFLNYKPAQNMPYNLIDQNMVNLKAVNQGHNFNVTAVDSHVNRDNLSIFMHFPDTIPWTNILPQNVPPAQCASVIRVSHHSGSSFSSTCPEINHNSAVTRKEDPIIYSPVSPYQVYDDDSSLILPAQTKLLNPYSQ